MAPVVYLDTSALVKRYVAEAGSDEVQTLLRGAEIVGTAAVAQVEMAAALAKAMRMGALAREEGQSALGAFLEDWPRLHRLRVTDLLLEMARNLAWREGLRGYDATHLAAALLWQEALGVPVLMATFDVGLWRVAAKYLKVWPPDMA